MFSQTLFYGIILYIIYIILFLSERGIHMKFNLNEKYMKICKYVIGTAVIIYLLISLIDSIPYFYDNLLLLLDSALSICMPIIVALIISYLLFGPMNAIENFLMNRKHFSKNRMFCRTIGLVISYIAVLGLFIGLLVGIYFMIGGKLSQSSTFTNIINYIADYFNNNSLSTESIKSFILDKNIPFGDLLASQIDSIASFTQDIFTSLIGGIASFIITLGSNIFSIVISLILSIYLLASYEYFIEIWNKFFFLVFKNSKAGVIIKRSLHTINFTFSKYIRGQLIEAFIVGVLSTIVLSIVGVDYAIVVGIITAVCNLVPYIGPFVGIVLSAIIALLSGSIWVAIAAVIGLFIIQQIDANILCPMIVGDIVGLQPAFIIVAITIGGNWAGLFGMLIAVPVAASIKTIISDWFDFYMQAKYEKHRDENQESYDINRNVTVSAFSGKKHDKSSQKNNDDSTVENDDTK